MQAESRIWDKDAVQALIATNDKALSRPLSMTPRAIKPKGVTPSHDGRPSVSRRWATEPFPRSWKLSSVSSEISRTSPTVFRPAAANTLRMRAGSSTSPIGVSSGSSGVGSSSLGSLTSSSPSAPTCRKIGDQSPNANRGRAVGPRMRGGLTGNFPARDLENAPAPLPRAAANVSHSSSSAYWP
jgi:hypothetical protein